MGVKDASINFPGRARRSRTRSRDNRNAPKLDNTRQTLLNDESNVASQHVGTLITEGNRNYKDVAVPDQSLISVTAKYKDSKNMDFRD